MRPKTFRISAKKLYLTYSQVHENMKHHDVLQSLKQKDHWNFNFLISREKHLDGGIHFHVLLTAKNKFNIRTQNFLDITYQEKTYHGNYQAAKSPTALVEYICKAGDYITDFTNIQQGQLLTDKRLLIQSALKDGVDNALLEHCKQLPEKALANLSLTGAHSYFEKLKALKENKQAQQSKDLDAQTPFTLNDFDFSKNPELEKWIHNPSKTLILAGPSGTGKTQFCKAFAQSRELRTLILSHTEDFKYLTHDHDCIIVDDANIHDLTDTKLLSVLDNTQNKTLRVLYKTVNKKQGLIQMFTMNNSEFMKTRFVLKEKRFARRVLFSEIKGPIINMNVNIQINNTTNNNYAHHRQQEDLFIKENIARMNACKHA